jgi:5-formyltetrahydrofolate cyclo-ligase
VTIDQAIRISQLNASKKKGEELPDPFTEQAASMTPDDIHALREKLVRKIMRLRDRERPRMIAAGWSFDEEYDHMVPPGWSRPAPR